MFARIVHYLVGWSTGSLLLRRIMCREYLSSSTGTCDRFRYDSIDLCCVRCGVVAACAALGKERICSYLRLQSPLSCKLSQLGPMAVLVESRMEMSENGTFPLEVGRDTALAKN